LPPVSRANAQILDQTKVNVQFRVENRMAPVEVSRAH
jgi:hypothetical protein